MVGKPIDVAAVDGEFSGGFSVVLRINTCCALAGACAGIDRSAGASEGACDADTAWRGDRHFSGSGDFSTGFVDDRLGQYCVGFSGNVRGSGWRFGKFARSAADVCDSGGCCDFVFDGSGR